MDVAFERNSSAAAAADVAAVQQQQQHVWTGTCCQLWVHQAFVLSVLQSLAAVRPDRLRKRVFYGPLLDYYHRKLLACEFAATFLMCCAMLCAAFSMSWDARVMLCHVHCPMSLILLLKRWSRRGPDPVEYYFYN